MKNFEKKLEKLKELYLPSKDYAIFGSGPLAIRGIRDSNDVDIIVKEKLWNKLTKVYPIETKYKINLGNIEIFRTWIDGFHSVDKLIDEAEIIDGIRFVKLEYVLEWKKLSGREKDIKDIDLINKYFKKI